MEDNFKRIAVIFGIIALMLVSLVWNAPAFKTQENLEPPLTENMMIAGLNRPVAFTGRRMRA